MGEGNEEKSVRRGGEGGEKKERKKKASHPSVPVDHQWRSSPSVSLGWGSGALQRL